MLYYRQQKERETDMRAQNKRTENKEQGTSELGSMADNHALGTEGLEDIL